MYWQNQSNKIKDCGTNTACFTANFKSCTPSKIYGGLTEVMSGTPESCKIIFTNMDDTKNTAGQKLIMECNVKNTTSYKDEEINGISVYDKGSVCTGSLSDFYASLYNSQSKFINNPPQK